MIKIQKKRSQFTVCIERLLFLNQQQRQKQLLSFCSTLCSQKSYQKACLIVQALQGSDVTSTVTLGWWLTYASHEHKKTQYTKPFCFRHFRLYALTCFVKTIPVEIKQHITQVKPETSICHNKPNPVWAAPVLWCPWSVCVSLVT